MKRGLGRLFCVFPRVFDSSTCTTRNAWRIRSDREETRRNLQRRVRHARRFSQRETATLLVTETTFFDEPAILRDWEKETIGRTIRKADLARRGVRVPGAI